MKILCGCRLRLVYLLVALTLLQGCSFFSTGYQNTVAYFNAYYNARKTFDDAVEETWKAQPVALRTNTVESPTVPPQTRAKFQSVIEKCSKIIQFYPQSSLVDDALLLIGKSYVYLNEILPAQRKFTELLTNFPRSDLRFETRLLLAKTQYLSGNHEEALNTLRSLIAEAEPEGEDDIGIQALLLEGQIHLDRKDYGKAVEVYHRALSMPGDARLHALAAFLLASSHEAKGDGSAASDFYLKVLDFSPDFLLDYQARLNAAKLIAELGQFDRAVSLLDGLSGEALNADQRSFVELELGNVYQKRGEYSTAMRYYSLVDSLYKHTDASARSNYQRGLMFERNLSDFAKAKTHYDKAKIEFPKSEITPSAAKRSEILGRYVAHRSELSKYDSLFQLHLRRGEPDDTASFGPALEDSVLVKRGGSEADSLNTVAVGQKRDSVIATLVPLDSVKQRRSTIQFGLGVLFLVDLDRPDSAALWLSKMLEEFPESGLAPQVLYVLAEVYRSEQRSSAVDSLHDVLLTRYPDSEYARNIKKLQGNFSAPLVPDSSEILYTHAVETLDAGNVQRALQQLKILAAKETKRPMGAKARHAVGWIYENILMRNDSALAHYRLLMSEQPHSVYADRVRPKIAVVDGKDAPAKDGAPLENSRGTERKAIEQGKREKVQQENQEKKDDESDK